MKFDNAIYEYEDLSLIYNEKFENLSEIVSKYSISANKIQYRDLFDNVHYFIHNGIGSKNSMHNWTEIDLYNPTNKLFKPNQKIHFIYGNPFIDIIVAKNPNNIEHIYLGAIYNDINQQKFSISFYDSENTMISSCYEVNYTNTGIQTIVCTPRNDSGVEIVCIVNVDLVETPQATLFTQLEIYQKDAFSIPADYIKTSDGVYLDNIKALKNENIEVVFKEKSDKTMLNTILNPLDISSNKKEYIMVHKISGDIQNYSLILRNSDHSTQYRYQSYDFDDLVEVPFPEDTTDIEILIVNNGIYNVSSDLHCYIYQFSAPKAYELNNHISNTYNYFREKRNTDASRLQKYIPLENLTDIMVHKLSGEYTDYRIYTCEDTAATGLTLMYTCKFDTVYHIDNIPENHKYIYLFNSSHNVNEDLSLVIHTFTEKSILLPMISDIANLKTNQNAIIDERLPLYNKNIVLFGDSISEFSYLDKSISVCLKDISSANVYNGAIGGTRLARRDDSTQVINTTSAYSHLDMAYIVKAWTSNDYTLLDQAVEYLKTNASDDNTKQINNLKQILPQDTDIVIIFAGTNDYTGGSTWGESSSEDDTEVAGAINNIIKMIHTANPAIQIYAFTPIVRYYENIRDDEHWSDNSQNSDNKTLPDLCDFIAECTKNNHIPTNNWYYTLGINQYNFSNYFLDTDGTHPHLGYEYLAQKMYKFICSN